MNLFRSQTDDEVERADLTKSYTFVTLLSSAFLTFLFYKYLISNILSGTVYSDIFLNRGPIPYITTFLFFWGVGLMFFLWRWLFQERATFNGISTAIQDFKAIDRQTAQDAIDLIKSIRHDEHGDISSNRFIRAMRRIKGGVKQPSDISEMMREQAYIDNNIINTKNAPIKFFIWLIPVLGFIGTVVGVSSAISGFSDIIMAGSDFSIVKGNLGGVTNSLGVAFDTTLLALSKTAILMFAFSTLQKQQLSFLITMDEFSADDLVKRVVPYVKRADKSETAQLTDAVDLLTEKITTWDPRFEEVLDTFFSRIEQESSEVIKSVTKLLDQGEQITEQNSQTAMTISGSMDRFKEYSSEVEQSVENLFAQVRETTEQNSQTAMTISGSMDRFKEYSGEIEQSVKDLFAQVRETTEQNSQTAMTISGSMDRFKQYGNEVEQSVQDLFAQVRETTRQNSQIANTISESMGRFQSHSSDVLRSVEKLLEKVKKTTGKNANVVSALSQTVERLAMQINEFNSLQTSLQENIRCITDLEEFNRCLESLTNSLDKLPTILTDMMRPREIRLMENRMEENR